MSRRGGKQTYKAKITMKDPTIGIIQAMSVPELINVINAAANELERRKLPVMDWDRKDHEFYKVTILGGKVYALFPKGDKRQ